MTPTPPPPAVVGPPSIHAPQGINIPPAVAGFIRGIGNAAAVAGLGFIVTNAASLPLPDSWKVYIPIIVLAARTLEGLVDQAVKGPGNGTL